MRTFTDSRGHEWQAAAAFGSHGAVQLIFSRRNGDELRFCDMQAETLHAAEQELASFTDVSLTKRLQYSEPWR